MLFDQLLTSVFIKTDVAFFPNSNPKFQFNFRTYSPNTCPHASHSLPPLQLLCNNMKDMRLAVQLKKLKKKVRFSCMELRRWIEVG